MLIGCIYMLFEDLPKIAKTLDELLIVMKSIESQLKLMSLLPDVKELAKKARENKCSPI